MPNSRSDNPSNSPSENGSDNPSDTPSDSPGSPRRKHDQVYKFFFSQAVTVAELLEDYIAPEWVDQLDLSTLKKLSPARVDHRLEHRQADMLWRVDFRHQPGFMALLIEFQSEVDPMMAARVLRYVTDNQENLIDESNKHRVPPVLACVVHNGRPPWRTATDIADLLSPMLPQLRDRTVRLPYQVLDMRAPPRRELRERRILTWLRELERDGGTTEKVLAVLDQVLEEYPDPEHARIPMAFELWAVGAARKWGRSDEELSQITTLLEARKMYTQIEEEMARLRAEGRQQGRQEGFRALERQVAKKFGAEAAVQLSGVIGNLRGRDQLNAAADAIIECDTIAELLARLAN